MAVSLWKVDDDATVALMKTFYHKLWAEGKPPLQALREAQLLLYRHPERIGELARSRGQDFDETVKLPESPTPQKEKADRAPTRAWADFVLSGVGR